MKVYKMFDTKKSRKVKSGRDGEKFIKVVCA